MNRRAQGISLNVIIIAAIALVVMVILIALVLNAGENVNTGVNSCENIRDGIEGQTADSDYWCAQQGEECPEGMTYMRTKSCAGSSENNPLRCCQRLI